MKRIALLSTLFSASLTFAASYSTNPDAGTTLDWNDPNSWLADGVATESAPTNADTLAVAASTPINIVLDGGTGVCNAGNYAGVPGSKVTIKNNATWNMVFVYTMTDWDFDVTDSTVNGFFAIAGGTSVSNFTNSALNGNFGAWGASASTLNLKNSTFAGDINYTFGGASDRSISISFENSVYNSNKSTLYDNDDFYALSELNMEFLGSQNDIQMNVLKVNEGEFSFVGDADGITTLNVGSFSIGESMSLNIDFTKSINFVGTENFEVLVSDPSSTIDTETFNKISANFTLANANDSAVLKLSDLGDSIYVEYTSTAVPEPGTYAAIFGAIALGFAAYRRRK
ncbi:MAG: PEP-CTERM sorting domain-containing protein [Opitutales bacterium]|nr:PEP-CTERM sorting domain-containing protein [Opitutales bacterium]